MPHARPEATRPPLIFQVTIPAPPQVVFQTFFADATRWFCRGGEVEQRVGGELHLCWPDGCVDGRFVQFEPPSTARFTWQPEGIALPNTVVVVGVRAAERQGLPISAVEVEHYGFGVGPAWEPLYLGAVRAWPGYLKNLRAVLETGVDLREDDE